MSATTRLTLHDCKVELRVPPPPPAATCQRTPAAYALEAAANLNDLTECYIGSTVFFLLAVTPPTSPKSLLAATRTLSDITVLLITPLTRESIRLPIVRESPWACTSNQLIKGFWVLIRSPPSANDSRPLATVGKQNIVVSIRETTASPRSSSVWATIDRAGRLFAKSVAIKASRAIILAMPIQITCLAACVGGSVDKTFLSVTVKNATSDAYISVVPPYINIASSKIIKELERDPKGTPVHLEGDFEFTPMYDTAPSQLDDDNGPKLTREESGESCEDYGLFIPSFNHLLRNAAKLGPREVFNFSFQVIQKGTSVETSAEVADQTAPVRLQQGEYVQTAVAVAWSCSKTEKEENFDDMGMNLQADLSAGRLLATGQRGHVAVHMTNVNWRPSSLLGGMVVTVSGPRTAKVGETVHISISVVNQTDQPIEHASVRVQEGRIECNLLAMRTAISVGRILVGGETTLQLPCLALESGAQGLGPIRVVEEDIMERRVWVSESEYKVLVLDDYGDGKSSEDVDMITERLAGLVAR